MGIAKTVSNTTLCHWPVAAVFLASSLSLRLVPFELTETLPRPVVDPPESSERLPAVFEQPSYCGEALSTGQEYLSVCSKALPTGHDLPPDCSGRRSWLRDIVPEVSDSWLCTENGSKDGFSSWLDIVMEEWRTFKITIFYPLKTYQNNSFKEFLIKNTLWVTKTSNFFCE